ncbi:hypothetical protein S40285_05790 [Stachybotrys chlorohalonatus IBT 40285]|uniref:Uncharacterized protein n=1 Tax=Stachybotrys chlorohalonatus (strain IBT 40285) TaxID=1283841 RepID=A0A084QAD9_STAC4|nr:hypothetical protein S40285_05790 [Stachybotrys chlorohalonata IBT 40285]
MLFRLAPRPLPLPRSTPFSSVPIRRASTETKQPSETAKFYKQFSRPVAKVLLLAVLTYQVAYWGWVKLETDEIRAETDGTIARLEAKVAEYEKKIGKPATS